MRGRYYPKWMRPAALRTGTMQHTIEGKRMLVQDHLLASISTPDRVDSRVGRLECAAIYMCVRRVYDRD